MFIAALYSLSNQVSKTNLEMGLIFPPVQEIRQVAARMAADIAKYIFDSGLAGVNRPENIELFIKDMMYKPEYN